MQNYESFLEKKIIKADPVGFDAQNINASAYEFQKDVVKALCKFGRGAGFLGTGLGKTLIQLNVGHETLANKTDTALILSPLSVAEQTVREGEKFGYKVNLCESESDVKPGLNITNYGKLHKFSPDKFGALILDESSIIKADQGKTFKQVCEFSQNIKYRFAFTATPAPNDYVELGNHAEFLGVMPKSEMLATFFEHDGGSTQDWNLSGWGEKPFWEFLCSFGIFMNTPSDLGYSDEGFTLPELVTKHVVVEGKLPTKAGEFVSQAVSLRDEQLSRRATLKERCEKTFEIAESVDSDQIVVWVDLDDEQQYLEELFEHHAVSVWGKTPDKKKIEMERFWREGGCQVLISKPKIFGYGLNWQNANRMIFCGINNSWETLHQASKRIHRKGQEKTCYRYLVYSEDDRRIWRNLERKQSEADYLNNQIREYSSQFSQVHSATFRQIEDYKPSVDLVLPNFLVSL